MPLSQINDFGSVLRPSSLKIDLQSCLKSRRRSYCLLGGGEIPFQISASSDYGYISPLATIAMALSAKVLLHNLWNLEPQALNRTVLVQPLKLFFWILTNIINTKIAQPNGYIMWVSRLLPNTVCRFSPHLSYEWR